MLYIQVNFSLQWSNPIWELADFDPSAELPSVKLRIKEAVRDVQHVNWTDLEASPDENSGVLTLAPPLVYSWWYELRAWWHDGVLAF